MPHANLAVHHEPVSNQPGIFSDTYKCRMTVIEYDKDGKPVDPFVTDIAPGQTALDPLLPGTRLVEIRFDGSANIGPGPGDETWNINTRFTFTQPESAVLDVKFICHPGAPDMANVRPVDFSVRKRFLVAGP